MKPSLKSLTWKYGSLTIYARGPYFHVRGTVRKGSRSSRIREALGIAAERANKQNAEAAAAEIEKKALDGLGGVKHSSVASLVLNRFKGGIGPTDLAILKDFAKEFGIQVLWDIEPAAIIKFVDDRQAGNGPGTRERYISTICAFLAKQIAGGQYPVMPSFVRDSKARNPEKSARRQVEKFRPELIQAIIDAAHPSIAIQIAVEWATGARVSSVLQGCSLGDLDLASMTLTFRKTKNGSDVPVALPQALRPSLVQYLEWRAIQVRRGRVGPGSNEPLFLTYKGKPYKPNGGRSGTQNKTGFNHAKRRAAEALAAEYDSAIAAMSSDQAEVDRLQRSKADDLSLLNLITQHWLRHKLATDLGRRDLKAAKKQGGWRDNKSLLRYMMEDAEYQRTLIEERGALGTNLTQRERIKDAK